MIIQTSLSPSSAARVHHLREIVLVHNEFVVAKSVLAMRFHFVFWPRSRARKEIIYIPLHLGGKARGHRTSAPTMYANFVLANTKSSKKVRDPHNDLDARCTDGNSLR